MNLRRIGDRLVPPIGLGTMLMTLPHPSPGVHEQPIEPAQARRTIHAALDAGVRVLDTAINYCMSEAEMAVTNASSPKRWPPGPATATTYWSSARVATGAPTAPGTSPTADRRT